MQEKDLAAQYPLFTRTQTQTQNKQAKRKKTHLCNYLQLEKVL